MGFSDIDIIKMECQIAIDKAEIMETLLHAFKYWVEDEKEIVNMICAIIRIQSDLVFRLNNITKIANKSDTEAHGDNASGDNEVD